MFWLKISVWLMLAITTVFGASPYEVSDDVGVGRKFDGIGGLSGGGPKFGASLHILKVEIGGDDQSTDGTEASHMHEEWDENYNRGYEWWLMKEAKKRNPSIKLYGLSWAWPGWIGNENNEPYKNLTKTATYTVKWILGAKSFHNLTIDYIGIWNEKDCNYDYVLTLRKILDDNKLQNVRIIACDGWWDSFGSFAVNKTLKDSVYAYGVHYPGATAPAQAIQSNETLWASEDYSTFNDEVGAGCWARVLNQNYVNGYMTSTISWNLIASYYFGLPYEGDGLMTAVQPWSGYYEVKTPIWITAHTTQFTDIDWKYLKHGHGVGLLEKGGSYVSLTSLGSKQLTIIIETMSRNHSICIRPFLPEYNVSKQKAVFKFGGAFSTLKKLFLWRTQLKFDGTPSLAFQYNGSVEVTQGRVALNLDVDSVYTLTTVTDGKHGDYGDTSKSSSFPLPYEDNFKDYALSEEPYYLAPQAGSWEIVKDGDLQYARQTVMSPPVSWCDVNPFPIAIIGDSKWDDINITATMRMPTVNGTDSVFVGAQTKLSDCRLARSTGIFFWINKKFSTYLVSSDLIANNILDVGLLPVKLQSDKWYTLNLVVKESSFNGSIDGVVVSSFSLPFDVMQKGWASLGSGSLGYSDVCDLKISLP